MPYIILLFFNHINIEFNGKGEKQALHSINTFWHWNKWVMKKWGNMTTHERIQNCSIVVKQLTQNSSISG